ncbi:MAG: FAD-dependent oxidoreductase [Deltaproteobacteria bacterium]|nr:FAD-dependent oxidoreductase [Deltaproteobacteria bacterium]
MTELSLAQLRAEIEKCEYCERKPCRDACPAHCSPADFIMAARVGEPADFQRAAALIYAQNPLGGVCGAVCPERHCMAACSRRLFDRAVQIRDVQETIVRRATALGVVPRFEEPAAPSGRRVAVVGAGPAGLAAAFALAKLGHRVEIFERAARPGGACRLIPEHRLPRELLEADLRFVLSSPHIQVHLSTELGDPRKLGGFDALLVAVGLTSPIALGIPGEEAAIPGWDYLLDPARHELTGPVAVVGGGAVACDCAVTARRRGAERVEMLALEKLGEMPLTERERQEILAHGIEVHGRTRLWAVVGQGGAVQGIETKRVCYPPGDGPYVAPRAPAAPFDPRAVRDLCGTEQKREDIRHVIVAVGQRASIRERTGLLAAGDCDTGPSSVVEAVAAGKEAAARIHADLCGAAHAPPGRPRKSIFTIPGYRQVPVDLGTDFFGRRVASPFLLSAAPPTDGYEQCKRAFEAGWPGAIVKTAFDGVPIHIPAEYMWTFGPRTWGNCDNVSGHALGRVCREIERLAREFPDRLVMASTGGPVTGRDDADRAGWQGNTRMLEAAGVMGIEYSLSCPQGGDGTEGDIVSQNAALTAKIIDWILSAGDANVPKLFKLTAAVTSVAAIVLAVREVLGRYPAAKAGVTLANTFPALGLRPGPKTSWEEGVVVGLSGEGVLPISFLTLAKVADLGVVVSGNGGPMDYKAAADFLALGAHSVQFCTLAMKYGYGIIDELCSGLAHLLRARGVGSVRELVGRALPGPVTDFMALPAKKKISACHTELCTSCGNCTRCSYLAIALDADMHPKTDPSRCIGCSICAKKCLSGALYLRERSHEELEALVEA